MDISKEWPVGLNQPLQVRNDFTWKEVGTLFRLIADHRVGLVIETGVGGGDIASWMICKCLFDPGFHYTGITIDIACVSPKIQEMLQKAPQAFIAPGLSYSDAILKWVSKFIHNSFDPVLVFCNGQNQVKEFEAYLSILRPGDVIVISGFPTMFPFGRFDRQVRTEKIQRVHPDITIGTRLLAGVVL